MSQCSVPVVSVILPSYNRAAMIDDAIQSVLDQVYTDWELIVVDDGSTDHTAAVVAARADPRISYVPQSRTGLAGARNTGIRRSTGRYVAFLDSDDCFAPHKLQVQAAAMEENPRLGLVAGGFVEVDEQRRILREVRPWHRQRGLTALDWLFSCPVCPGAVLVRRGWLERAGWFDEAIHGPDDWDLWLRLSLIGCDMAWNETLVCSYRVHGGNMVRDAQLMRSGMLAMLDKLYARTDLPAEMRAAQQRAYANVHLNAAARAYASGLPVQGKESLARAFDLNPALLDEAPPRALSSLASFALTPMAGDATDFLRVAAGDFPARTGVPSWPDRKLRAVLHAVRAFEQFQEGAAGAGVRDALRALASDASWARNRGLLALVGRGLWQQLRARLRELR